MCRLRQIGDTASRRLLLAVSRISRRRPPAAGLLKLGGSLWLQRAAEEPWPADPRRRSMSSRSWPSGNSSAIVIGHCLFFVDLPEGPGWAVVEQILPPAQSTDSPETNIARKGQLGCPGREAADCDAGVFRCREPSRPRSEVAGGKLVANLRRSRSYVLQAVVTHLGTPMWEARQPVPSIPFFRACASSYSRR